MGKGKGEESIGERGRRGRCRGEGERVGVREGVEGRRGKEASGRVHRGEMRGVDGGWLRGSRGGG